MLIFFVDRKALEEQLAEDSDDDEGLDEKFLNLEGDDGWFLVFNVFLLFCPELTMCCRGRLGRGLCLPRNARERGTPYISSTFCGLSTIWWQGARLREKAEKVEEEEDDDDESEDEDIEEELGYISALETVNPYVSFKQALTSTSPIIILVCLIYKCLPAAFQMQNGPSYQAGTTGLSVEQQTLLMEVMRLADVPSA
jgi:importin-7